MNARAVFLDRDGTIIEDTGYVDDTGKVRLLPGAAQAIARFNRAGYLVVIVSNQSGVARGLFDEDTLSTVHQRVESLLTQQGATIDGAYYCPYLDGPDAVIESYRRDSSLRKPQPGMLLQAAEELNIDLEQSWMIGDSKRDVKAGTRAGCQTIRLSAEDDPRATYTVADLSQAAAIVEKAAMAVVSPSKSTRSDARGHASAGEVLRSGTSTGRAASAGVTVPAKTTTRSASPITDPPVSRKDNDEFRADRAEIIRALERIHDQLDRANRPQRQRDFSMLRLCGALLQMLAIVAVIVGVMKMVDDQDAAATARYTLGCFLQLASLTAFAVDRFR